MSLERVVDCRCELGEGPIWHPDEERLYWVNIEAGRVHRYDPSNETHEHVFETDVVSGLTVQQDGSLLLFMDRGRVGRLVDGELTTVRTVLDQDVHSRFNDVIANPAGRVFCGTMPTESRGGRLYRLDRDGSTAMIEEGVGIPNGMGFTRDRTQFYFTETQADIIYQYAYDGATGGLSTRERFIQTPETAGLPDGLTVDAEGYLWSARWQGGCVIRYDQTGTEVGWVDIPATKVTSVAFGGPAYEHLYITTAGGADRPITGVGAGALFRFDPGVNGRSEFPSSVDL